MATKYSFKIDRSKEKVLKDGSFPIALVIRKEGQRKKIYLGLSANEYLNEKKELISQWNDKFQRYETDRRKKDLHPDRDKNNDWLNKLSIRCKDVIEDFDKNRIDWTLNQFEQALLNKSKKSGIEAFLLQYIERLDHLGKFGNKRCYQGVLDMLRKFDHHFGKRVFNEIDLKYVKRFSDFLEERGQSGNTKKYYMKTLRSVLNKAIKDGECSAVSYPFGKDGYSITGLAQETDKRYLPNEYIEELKTAELKTYPLNWSRNLFLFSYYCQGMSIVDMAALRNQNIIVGEGDSRYIVYRRQKTEGKNTKFIRIKISDPIRNLLEWFKTCKLIDDYLLPIVSIEGYEGQQLYTHIRDRYKRYNRHLKKLGEELKFEGIRLSSYQSRHSYAMRLKNSGISEDVISEALGHKDLKTTKVYLDSFQNGEVEKANEVL
ncbi:MAG TPA: site-specific integrase [Prolixibacteraceae bacterium]|nr:site-specific integrase [Prolixibacteraceae bacterium]